VNKLLKPHSQPTNQQFIFRNITKTAMRTLQTAAEGYRRSHMAQWTGRLCNDERHIARYQLQKLLGQLQRLVLSAKH